MQQPLRCGARSRAVSLWLALVVSAVAASAQTAVYQRAGHVLRRTSYGVSVEDFAGLLAPDTSQQTPLILNYLLGQLNLTPTENAETTSLLGLYPNVPQGLPLPRQPGSFTLPELIETNVARAVFSEYQLREMMVHFWQRHFSTSYHKLRFYFAQRFAQPPYSTAVPPPSPDAYAAYFEMEQNALFRQHWKGPFDVLLRDVSAKGAAMMIYLDTVESVGSQPNENYARELMELHTLGPSAPYLVGGVLVPVPSYSYQDIVYAAKMLAGWRLIDTSANPSVPNFVFTFDGNMHQYVGQPASYTIFDSALPPDDPSGYYTSPFVPKVTIPTNNSSESEGVALLDHLAGSLVTAHHVIGKLYQFFIAEEVPPFTDPVMIAALGAWGTNGNIDAVLQVLLSSSRFLDDSTIRRQLARMPLEGVGQTIQGLRGRVYNPSESVLQNKARLQTLRTQVLEDQLGFYMFQFPSPDGFPTASREHLTTQRLLGNDKLRQEVYGYWNLATYPWVPGRVSFDWVSMLAQYGINVVDEASLTNFFVTAFLTGDEGPSDWSYLYDFFRRDSAGIPLTQSLAQVASTNFPEYEKVLTQGVAFAASLSLNNLK